MKTDKETNVKREIDNVLSTETVSLMVQGVDDGDDDDDDEDNYVDHDAKNEIDNVLSTEPVRLMVAE